MFWAKTYFQWVPRTDCKQKIDIRISHGH